MRVLIAEDDRSVAAALAAALNKAGMTCTHVARGQDVLERCSEVDVVMLDLGLEDMDGIDVLRKLRESSEVPVVVVTARGDERSTVQALTAGADDYVVKPVRLHELLARLVAVNRRAAGANSRVEIAEVVIDPEAHSVLHDGVEIPLTHTEFALITALGRRPGTAVSRQSLLESVWGRGYAATSRSLDVHLAHVRQKLPMLTITTIHGYGYRLEASP